MRLLPKRLMKIRIKQFLHQPLLIKQSLGLFINDRGIMLMQARGVEPARGSSQWRWLRHLATVVGSIPNLTPINGDNCQGKLRSLHNQAVN